MLLSTTSTSVGAEMVSVFKAVVAASDFISLAYSERDGLLKVLHRDDVRSYEWKLAQVCFDWESPETIGMA